MPRERANRYGDERITLRQTLVIAVVLHLMLAGVLQWNPDLLWSDPVAAPEPRPIEFRFVDAPESDESPDTDVLSDVDRVAADASERDDAPDPFSEGNTPQEVFRGEPEPAPEPIPETPPPALESEPVSPVEPNSEPVSPTEKPAEELVAQPDPDTPQPLSSSAPPLPPPRPRTLRDSLVRGLQQYIEPEVFANSDGGTSGSQGLVSFDTKGFDLGPYLNEVLRIIERNWKNNIPPAARWQGQDGAVFVNLSIVRDRASGNERAIITVTRSWSSGKPAFDQSALLALEISSPLPPLPDFFPYDQLDGRLGFLYNLDPSQVTFPSQR